MRAVAFPMVLSCIGLLGCTEVAPQSSDDTSSVATVSAADQVQPSADYDRCIEAAGGTDPDMMACTAEEIARTQAALTQYLKAAGRDAEQIGTAQLAYEAALPSLSGAILTATATGAGPEGTLDRLTVASRVITLTLERAALLKGEAGQTPAMDGQSEPHASDRDWMKSRNLSCGLVSAGDSDARYDALLGHAFQPVDRQKETGPMTSGENPLFLPTCAALHASAEHHQTLLNEFERQYPKALVAPETVNNVVLTEVEIGSTTASLACLAQLSDYDPFVVEQSLALFDSQRHGAKALAALDDLAASDGPEAESGRRFAEQVRSFLAEPTA